MDRGAPIKAAPGTEEEETPLHMAAENGHVEVMELLIRRGMDANATSPDLGPVINSAILSGNRKAIELLVKHGVALTIAPGGSRKVDPPLALAAQLSDLSMFEYLIEQYAEKLPAEEYSKALVKSAEVGNFEVVQRLLEFDHDSDNYQRALDKAAEQGNEDVVEVLLSKRAGLDCKRVFLMAATIHGDQDKLLDIAWNYAKGAIPRGVVNQALYMATDYEKAQTVQLLLEEPYQADPNARGKE